MRYFFILFLSALVCTACGPEKINPCDSLDCGSNGSCVVQNDQATCSCKGDWKGPICANNLDYDFPLGHTVICPEGGSYTISGLTGDDARRNGYQYTVKPGKLSECAHMVVQNSQNIPLNYNKGEIQKYEGFRLIFLKKGEPYTDDGGLNYVADPVVEVFIPKRRATPVDEDEKELPAQFTPEGTRFEVRARQHVSFSNSKPILKVEVTPVEGKTGTFRLDFNGTTDEGSTSLAMLKFKALLGGTPVELKKVETGVYLVTVEEVGDHRLDLQAIDTYQAVGIFTTDLQVPPTDLCKDVVCQDSWQTCNPSTGECEGDKPDPCQSVDCGNHGSCDVVNNLVKCECRDGYTGDRCEVEPEPPTVQIEEMPAPCSVKPVPICKGATRYIVYFTYTGVINDVQANVVIDSPATPGTITDIKFANGKGSFVYTSSSNGGGRYETITLKVLGPYGEATDSRKHGII